MEKQELRVARGQYVNDAKREQARDFRKNPTPFEEMAWRILRNRGVLGLKFRRQQIIGRYVLDFYCAELSIGIELDGPVHEETKEYDSLRDEYLTQKGITILRLHNEDLSRETLTNLLKPFLPS